MINRSDNITIEIDGERFEITTDGNGIISTGPNRTFEVIEENDTTYQVRDGDNLHKINVIEFDVMSRTCTVEMDGRIKQVRILRDLDILIEKMGLNSSRAKKQSLLLAPMPGLVTEIKVAVGDHVVKDAPLLILEAMKMENVISAPHEVVIKEIKVNIGQAVERGSALIEFSPA